MWKILNRRRSSKKQSSKVNLKGNEVALNKFNSYFINIGLQV